MEIIDSQKQFSVAKYWADNYLDNKICYFDPEHLLSELKEPELSDARCLVRMVKKEVDAYNSKIKAKRKLIANLKYKTNRTSNLFAGIPIPKERIKKTVEENPDKTAFEIFYLLK